MGNNTRRAYDLAAPTYDAEPNSVLFTEDGAVLELLALRRGERLLDAACGTGKYLLAAARAGAGATGLDFSPEMLRRAAGKCPRARLSLHDLEELPLPFPARAFDAVVFAHGVRHVRDIAGLFAEFGRLLRPGGRLVVSVTHPEAPFKLFRYRAGDLGDYEEPDLAGEKFAHGAGELAEAAAAAGLCLAAREVIEVDSRLAAVLTPASLRRTAGRPLILVFRFDRPHRAAGKARRPAAGRGSAGGAA